MGTFFSDDGRSHPIPHVETCARGDLGAGIRLNGKKLYSLEVSRESAVQMGFKVGK
jgi:hypothetical protein